MTNRQHHVVRLIVSLLAIPLLGITIVAVADDDEQPVAFKDLPQAIQNALSQLDADDIEVETEMQDGKRVYEVEFEVDDAEVELTLTEDGRLLAVEVEEDDDADDAADDE